MVKFRFALLLAVGAFMQLVPLVQTVSAAGLPSTKDAPYEFVPLWTGFYFGVHGGGAWGNTRFHDTFDYVGDPTVGATVSKIAPIGGGHLGYNFQYGRLVFGLEGDVGYLNLSAKSSAKNVGPNYCSRTYTDGVWEAYRGQYCKVDTNYSGSSNLYGDLTGRLGFLWGRTLFYGKGGVALLNADFKANYAGGNCTFDWGCGGNWNVPSSFQFGHSDVLVGWTAGAGVEYKISPSWSFKAEYQHFDFGNMSYSYSGTYKIPGMASGCYHDGHYTSIINGKTDVWLGADAVTLGINYHLSNEAELR